MPRALLIFAHPLFEKSRVNADLVEAARDVDGVTVRDLYETYPDFGVDVAKEQALLEAHELIVLQHPFFWYSMPALLKEWLDLVLQYGWAYGDDGKALHGKTLLSAITTGGDESAYRHEGHNRYTMREFLRPLEQTAHLCGMRYAPPFIVHRALQIDNQACRRHATDYARLLEAAVAGKIDWEAIGERFEVIPCEVEEVIGG